jgi:hypothetical protein
MASVGIWGTPVISLTARQRKLTLFAHISSSVGWVGAVAAFLVLAVTGLTNKDVLLVRAACLAMELVTWYVIVPLALISLSSGFVSSLGTGWGLFRYYWILVKFLITIFATIVLAIHTQPIDLLASVAATTAEFGADLHDRQRAMAIAAGAALAVLLALTALSVYKPQGITPYGHRERDKPGGLLRP